MGEHGMKQQCVRAYAYGKGYTIDSEGTTITCTDGEKGAMLSTLCTLVGTPETYSTLSSARGM